MRFLKIFTITLSLLFISFTASAEVIQFPSCTYEGEVDNKNRADGNGKCEFNNIGNVSPAPTTKTITVTSGTSDLGVQNFNSDVSCAIRSSEEDVLPFLLALVLGFFAMTSLGLTRKS